MTADCCYGGVRGGMVDGGDEALMRLGWDPASKDWERRKIDYRKGVEGGVGFLEQALVFYTT